MTRPCWECEVREALPNERYCAVCEEKTAWINDFYEQFGDQTMANNSRRLRGRRTELVVATYFQRYWGRAEAVGSGASGSDIKNTPFDIEVKARSKFEPLQFIKQQKQRDEGKLKFVVMRCNGQGENPEDYVFIARLGDMMPLLEDRVPSEAIVRCKGCGTWMTDGKVCDVCQMLKENL